ncbi:MAG: carboxymuconolactone decarboxylase family protein [Chloroflexi bacterium]|nr:carboxymuconolactone decarboxylase family protein [Chloroflexota bacterium]
MAGEERAAESREARTARIIDTMNRGRGQEVSEWRWATEMDPDFMEEYARWSANCWSPSYERALEPKYRSLIAICLLASKGYHWTLVPRMRRAIELGATKQEILEALESCVLLGGAAIMHLGLKALMEVERGEG